eukprot:10740785-Lingulodinium_polyedra.AAC.1
MLSLSSRTIFLVRALLVADGISKSNLDHGTVVGDIVDDDTVVDGQSDVGEYCEYALCATMD